MTQFLSLTLILFCTSLSLAFKAIQVPESCAGAASPCLVKTQSKHFNFDYAGYQVRLSPDTIFKVTSEADHVHFSILKGEVLLNQLQKKNKLKAKSASLNTVMLTSQKTFASRQQNNIQMLDGESFFITEYRLEGATQEEVYALKVKHEFLNKKDLISFVKKHFSHLSDLKSYLKQIEKPWVVEFKKQNEIQTKALMRSVASEEEIAMKQAQERKRQEELHQKARNKLFYRTFER